MTDLAGRFTYHAPTSEKILRMHEVVRREAAQYAAVIEELVPEGREKALAFTNLEQAMFWANAGIARISNYEE